MLFPRCISIPKDVGKLKTGQKKIYHTSPIFSNALYNNSMHKEKITI